MGIAGFAERAQARTAACSREPAQIARTGVAAVRRAALAVHGLSDRPMLLATVDDPHRPHGRTGRREVTEQLEPERARGCRNAITMCSVMVDEIRLRAHARPLDSDEE